MLLRHLQVLESFTWRTNAKGEVVLKRSDRLAPEHMGLTEGLLRVECPTED